MLAGLSHLIIADITNPKSAPLELQATVPEIMVPFRPIIEKGEQPFAMLQDLWIKHRDWVFEPIHYSSLEALVGALDEKIIKPAEARFVELLAKEGREDEGRACVGASRGNSWPSPGQASLKAYFLIAPAFAGAH